MRKKHLVWVHIAYWLYVFVISEFVNKLAYQNKIYNPFEKFGPLAVSNYIIFGGLFYLNYFTVLPFLFRRKKYFLTLLSWLAIVFAFIGIRYYIQEVFFFRSFGICNYCLESTGIYIVNNFFQGFSNIIMAGTIIWFFDNWLKIEKQKRLLEHEKIEAEKAFLQSQVNPHFLFNTLNNIYSMVYHGSAFALKAIQKLSEIMRYSISEKANTGVELPVEITYLKNYIELQSFRVDKPAICYEEKGEMASKKIVPMLLISFVENAFKHGVLNDAQDPLTIKLTMEKDELTFFVHNKINISQPDNSSGVGLSSVKKRLELSYPGRYRLSIKHENFYYTTQLFLLL